MPSSDLEARVCSLIEERGPQTGGEIRDALPAAHPFELWRTCRRSSRLATRRVGRRYLRLDEKVPGYARLSPSILREFLTYSVVGLADDLPSLEKRTELLAASIRDINANKLSLASRVLDEVAAKITPEEAGRICSRCSWPVTWCSRWLTRRHAPNEARGRWCVAPISTWW